MWKTVLDFGTYLFCDMSTGSFYGRLASSYGMAWSPEEDHGWWVKKWDVTSSNMSDIYSFRAPSTTLLWCHWLSLHSLKTQFLHEILENDSPNAGAFRAH